MRSAPPKSLCAEEEVVCGQCAVLRLWRDFIIGSYRTGRDGQTGALAIQINPENLKESSTNTQLLKDKINTKCVMPDYVSFETTAKNGIS